MKDMVGGELFGDDCCWLGRFLRFFGCVVMLVAGATTDDEMRWAFAYVRCGLMPSYYYKAEQVRSFACRLLLPSTSAASFIGRLSFNVVLHA